MRASLYSVVLLSQVANKKSFPTKEAFTRAIDLWHSALEESATAVGKCKKID